MQIINKKCPYCSAIFKVKSALESHLQTKHPEKQMINIDSIPEIKYQTSKDTIMELATSSHNVVQPAMSVDYWKTKLGLGLHPLAVQQHKPSRKKLSDFSESEISFTDSNNDEQPDDYELENFNDDSNQIESNTDNVQRKNNKRHRTHVNRVQKSILRKIFEDVKSPSMIDCEKIGHEIGLFKRVVQVS